MGDIDISELNYTRKIYVSGSNATKLNTIDIWLPGSPPVPGDGKLWLIFIHGGAWRDPKRDSGCFEPAVKALWDSAAPNSIGGFASINYRLSPYPGNPSSPDDPSRNVQYPSHLEDVGHALLCMEKEYGIDNRYLLVGHSAGATMTFELHDSYFPHRKLPLPVVVLGVAGIYHFEEFVQAHSEIPAYKEFMESAFPDKSQWEKAGPATNRLPNNVWEQARAIIVSHSDEDTLVEKRQASLMLERARLSTLIRDRVHFLEASGDHDDIWESGYILAGLITKSLEILRNQTG